MKKTNGKYLEIGILLASAFLPILIEALKPKRVVNDFVAPPPTPFVKIAFFALTGYAAFIALTVFLVKIAWRYIL